MSDAPQLNKRELAQLSPPDQIDLTCDAFEDAWARGETPHIEDYLEQCEAPVRALLLAELLLVDREFRIKRGEQVTRQSYLERFPDHSTYIEGLEFATINDRGHGGASTLRDRPVTSAGGKIAHFELLEELGAGASGAVWKARDLRLRRIVAVKIPRQESLSDLERGRFRREGQASAQLQHPSIVAIFEVGEDRSQVFIVAEFIDGMNLREWLQLRKPKFRESAELTAQLAEALHHAHEQGVIHRDLKPANVLMDHDGRPHITDFGLAKWTTDSAGMTIAGNILGTPAYMSPEQARGDSFTVDRRTDVYGLGALLYEMLTGQPPFQGDVAAIVHQVIHDELRPPRKIESTVPRDLETICLKAMEKEPSRRYPSAQEMAVDLRRFLRGESILARRAGLPERGWRWVRRRPSIAAMIGLVLIAVSSIGMAAILAVRNHDLLGLQTVTINTDPPGAQIVIVPLSETTGEPMPSGLIQAGRSPVTEQLPSGDYLIVAALDDKRFKEVQRRVPGRNTSAASGSYKHNRWTILPDGTVVIPTINLPESDPASNMALIEGGKMAETSPDGTVPPHAGQPVDSFYLDPLEFTVADYQRVMDGELPRDRRWQAKPSDYAVNVTYDEAVALAEKVFKRLPTELEYEYAATGGGKYQHPWGDGPFERPDDLLTIGPVGIPEADRLATSPPVFGLCSNVAEWTSSFLALTASSAFDQTGQTVPPTTGEYRVVKGGAQPLIETGKAAAPSERDPTEFVGYSRFSLKAGLGFRCVRSAKPRLTSGDFELRVSAGNRDPNP